MYILYNWIWLQATDYLSYSKHSTCSSHYDRRVDHRTTTTTASYTCCSTTIRTCICTSSNGSSSWSHGWPTCWTLAHAGTPGVHQPDRRRRCVRPTVAVHGQSSHAQEPHHATRAEFRHPTVASRLTTTRYNNKVCEISRLEEERNSFQPTSIPLLGSS
jgi:hypothetical protein